LDTSKPIYNSLTISQFDSRAQDARKRSRCQRTTVSGWNDKQRPAPALPELSKCYLKPAAPRNSRWRCCLRL